MLAVVSVGVGKAPTASDECDAHLTTGAWRLVCQLSPRDAPKTSPLCRQHSANGPSRCYGGEHALLGVEEPEK